MDLRGHSVNQDTRRELEENLFHKMAQRLVDGLTSNLEKKFNIERLKALGATTFKGTTNAADVEKWLSLMKKCFGVMECPKKEELDW